MNAKEIWPEVADLRQYASVRRIMLDDGPERGVRALAFSTGGGLDFWVMSDRSLDIGPLSWRGSPVGWQSATGFVSPTLIDREGDRGMGFMRGFSGMLVTCGLDHVSAPNDGHPLHGRFPFTPARVLSYGEDWDRQKAILYCSGEVDQIRHLGENIRLSRRIEADIGGSELRIFDRVTNIGHGSQDHHLLYHINFGWPALDKGSEVILNRKGLLPAFGPVDPEGQQSVVFFPVGGEKQAECIVTLPGLKAEAVVTFDTATLPVLQIWRDTRPRNRVLALEPRASQKMPDGTNGPALILAPGEHRDYAVKIALRASM